MMFNATAMRDYGTLYRGDQFQVRIYMFTGENGLAGYNLPPDATIKVGMAAATGDAPVVTEDVVIVSGVVGVIQATMSKEQTALLKPSQAPVLVVTVEKDQYVQTFEIRAPFTVKARSLGVL